MSRGTWSTNPQPKPFRAALGILFLVVVVAVSLMAPGLRSELNKQAGAQVTPSPSASARR